MHATEGAETIVGGADDLTALVGLLRGSCSERIAKRDASISISQLYHYTNASGLKGILDYEAIWFTHYRHLNDPAELEFALDVARRLFDERGSALLEGTVAHLFCALLLDLFTLENVQKGIGFYVASFSQAFDDLEQWRLYGDNGRGFALAFTPSFLMTPVEVGAPQRIAVREVAYGEEAARAQFAPALDQALTLVDGFDWKKVGKSCALQILRDMADEVMSELLASLIGVKHAAYAHEREVRAILVDGGGISKLPLDVRVRGAELIPYVSQRFANLRAGISSILAGPASAPVSLDALQVLLNRYSLPSNLAARSKMPYRPA